jgi:hypothetical protein
MNLKFFLFFLILSSLLFGHVSSFASDGLSYSNAIEENAIKKKAKRQRKKKSKRQREKRRDQLNSTLTDNSFCYHSPKECNSRPNINPQGPLFEVANHIAEKGCSKTTKKPRNRREVLEYCKNRCGDYEYIYNSHNCNLESEQVIVTAPYKQINHNLKYLENISKSEGNEHLILRDYEKLDCDCVNEEFIRYGYKKKDLNNYKKMVEDKVYKYWGDKALQMLSDMIRYEGLYLEQNSPYSCLKSGKMLFAIEAAQKTNQCLKQSKKEIAARLSKIFPTHAKGSENNPTKIFKNFIKQEIDKFVPLKASKGSEDLNQCISSDYLSRLVYHPGLKTISADFYRPDPKTGKLKPINLGNYQKNPNRISTSLLYLTSLNRGPHDPPSLTLDREIAKKIQQIAKGKNSITLNDILKDSSIKEKILKQHQKSCFNFASLIEKLLCGNGKPSLFDTRSISLAFDNQFDFENFSKSKKSYNPKIQNKIFCDEMEDVIHRGAVKFTHRPKLKARMQTLVDKINHPVDRQSRNQALRILDSGIIQESQNMSFQKFRRSFNKMNNELFGVLGFNQVTEELKKDARNNYNSEAQIALSNYNDVIENDIQNKIRKASNKKYASSYNDFYYSNNINTLMGPYSMTPPSDLIELPDFRKCSSGFNTHICNELIKSGIKGEGQNNLCISEIIENGVIPKISRITKIYNRVCQNNNQKKIKKLISKFVKEEINAKSCKEVASTPFVSERPNTNNFISTPPLTPSSDGGLATLQSNVRSMLNGNPLPPRSSTPESLASKTPTSSKGSSPFTDATGLPPSKGDTLSKGRHTDIRRTASDTPKGTGFSPGTKSLPSNNQPISDTSRRITNQKQLPIKPAEQQQNEQAISSKNQVANQTERDNTKFNQLESRLANIEQQNKQLLDQNQRLQRQLDERKENTPLSPRDKVSNQKKSERRPASVSSTVSTPKSLGAYTPAALPGSSLSPVANRTAGDRTPPSEKDRTDKKSTSSLLKKGRLKTKGAAKIKNKVASKKRDFSKLPKNKMPNTAEEDYAILISSPEIYSNPLNFIKTNEGGKIPRQGVITIGKKNFDYDFNPKKNLLTIFVGKKKILYTYKNNGELITVDSSDFEEKKVDKKVTSKNEETNLDNKEEVKKEESYYQNLQNAIGDFWDRILKIDF